MAGAGSLQVAVRRATQEDIQRLAAVLAPEVGAEQVNRRWQEHQAGYREMLIAELMGQPAGTVSTGGHRFQSPGSLRMFALDVGAVFRSQGIGTALIKAVENEARRKGLKSVNLEVALQNPDALRLYERLGYRRTGERVVDRWTRLADDGDVDQVEDLSWVMTKELRGSSEG